MRDLVIAQLTISFDPSLDWIVPTQSAINGFAMLAVCLMFLSRAREAGLDQGYSLSVAAIGILGGFAGAKALGVALAAEGGKGLGGTLSYFGAGVVSWGAFGGCFVSVVVYLKLRVQRLPFVLFMLTGSRRLS